MPPTSAWGIGSAYFAAVVGAWAGVSLVVGGGAVGVIVGVLLLLAAPGSAVSGSLSRISLSSGPGRSA